MKALLFVTVGGVLMSCASVAYRSHADLPARKSLIRSITLLPPAVDIYELSAGGAREKMDEWSEQGTQNIRKALEVSLWHKSARQFREIKGDSLAANLQEELFNTRALYQAVDESIILHTYTDDNLFREKIEDFDYTLGPEVSALDSTADAYIAIRAVDHISSAGRKTAQAGAMILGALFGVQVTPRGGATLISISLVDAQTGNILWHRFGGAEGSYDLRDPTSTQSIIYELLKDFPL